MHGSVEDWLLPPLVSTVVQDIVDVISVIHLRLHSCYAIDHVEQQELWLQQRRGLLPGPILGQTIAAI